MKCLPSVILFVGGLVSGYLVFYWSQDSPVLDDKPIETQEKQSAVLPVKIPLEVMKQEKSKTIVLESGSAVVPKQEEAGFFEALKYDDIPADLLELALKEIDAIVFDEEMDDLEKFELLLEMVSLTGVSPLHQKLASKCIQGMATVSFYRPEIFSMCEDRLAESDEPRVVNALLQLLKVGHARDEVVDSPALEMLSRYGNTNDRLLRTQLTLNIVGSGDSELALELLSSELNSPAVSGVGQSGPHIALLGYRKQLQANPESRASIRKDLVAFAARPDISFLEWRLAYTFVRSKMTDSESEFIQATSPSNVKAIDYIRSLDR